MTLNMESISVEKVCTSLGGSIELLTELRERLQDWLKLQPHLPQDVPNEILEHFILGTKLSLEQAKRKLDMFYTMKRLVPELLTGRDPRGPSFTRLHKMTLNAYLPKLTPENYRVCIFQPIADDYSEYSAYDSFKYSIMMDEMLMTENDSHSLGMVYVADFSTITLGYLAKYTPTVVKKFEVTITEAYAKRIKGIHFYNAPPLADSLISMVKKVIKPKLATRIHVHVKGKSESLYDYIPKSILPKDYDGDEQSMAYLHAMTFYDAELWCQKVDSKRDWFLEQEKIVVDERLRPGPAVDGDNLFGFAGSFRKLNVD